MSRNVDREIGSEPYVAETDLQTLQQYADWFRMAGRRHRLNEIDRAISEIRRLRVSARRERGDLDHAGKQTLPIRR